MEEPKQLSYNLKALKRIRFLPTRLLEEIYFKPVLSRVTYCIGGVWGNCSVSILKELENLHIKAGRIIKIYLPMS